MTRNDLLALLADYGRRHPDEEEMLSRILTLMETRGNCFDRDCLPGHITASAWIVSEESRAVLLTHHRKLERWLQLGGHTDGEANVLAAAMREAEEESGMTGFAPWPAEAGPLILDIDVHLIPARKNEPAHEHHDIRFLLEVSEKQAISRQVEESHDVRWFGADEVGAYLDEESLARMARKANAWLAGDRPRLT